MPKSEKPAEAPKVMRSVPTRLELAEAALEALEELQRLLELDALGRFLVLYRREVYAESWRDEDRPR